MEIKNKWVVHETRDNTYFTGMNARNYPVLEHLNSRVRTYDSERAAKCAIQRITESGIEYCEFVAEYIARENVPDAPRDEPKTEDASGWETLDSFGKRIKYKRRKTPTGYEFEVVCDDGLSREFGADELAAWQWYSDYRRDFGSGLIQRRLEKQA